MSASQAVDWMFLIALGAFMVGGAAVFFVFCAKAIKNIWSEQ